MRRAAGPAAWHCIVVHRLFFTRDLHTVAVSLVHMLTLLDLAGHLIPQPFEEELDRGLQEVAEAQRVGETRKLAPGFPTRKLGGGGMAQEGREFLAAQCALCARDPEAVMSWHGMQRHSTKEQ